MSDKQDSVPHLPDRGYEEEQEQRRLRFEAEQDQKRQLFEARLEAQKAKRDWMMVIITFAAVAAAYWTGYEARHARIEAAQAAKESLRTQQQSVDAQIQTMQVEQRPYINVTFERFNTDPLGSDSVQVHVNLTSNGRTPATAVRVRTYCEQAEITDFSKVLDPSKKLWENPTPRESIYESIQDRDYLMPGQSMQTECSFVVDAHSEEPMKIIGIVSYIDLFELPHITPFCFVSYRRGSHFGSCVPAMVKNMPSID